jgi:hypothetical protein
MKYLPSAIAMLVVLGSPASAAEPVREPHYITVCCPDQQALDTAVALARLGDRQGLAIHIRSFCDARNSGGRPMICGSVVAD